MNAVIKAPRKTRSTKAKKGITKSKFAPVGYALRDGRAVELVPWAAQTPQPWRQGYARVFIPYTATELRNARNGKRGHEQIVSSSKLVRF